MKTLKTILVILFFVTVLIGCAAKYTIPENVAYDAEFIGMWEGKHVDEISGHWRKWVQTRKGDGTYTIHMKFYDKNEKLLSESEETGYWWIKNDLFYEIPSAEMKKPESYLYKILDKDKIEFTSVKPGSDYSFVDTRVSE